MFFIKFSFSNAFGKYKIIEFFLFISYSTLQFSWLFACNTLFLQVFKLFIFIYLGNHVFLSKQLLVEVQSTVVFCIVQLDVVLSKVKVNSLFGLSVYFIKIAEFQSQFHSVTSNVSQLSKLVAS